MKSNERSKQINFNEDGDLLGVCRGDNGLLLRGALTRGGQVDRVHSALPGVNLRGLRRHDYNIIGLIQFVKYSV